MIRLFVHIQAVEKVMIFGSRAAGTFRLGSDVDLVIMGKELTQRDIAYMHEVLESKSPALLWFDVLHYETLKSEALKEEIANNAKIIYTR